MRCPGPILAGSKHTSKALDSALGEAYPEAEEVETEPEAEDRAREDVRPARTPLPDGRMECEFCGRKFNPASYERHQPICQKVFGGTRPQFLSSQVSKGSDRARAANRGGGPVGQGSNGHSPRSPKAPTQRSQPGHSSPRGSAGENPGHGKNAVAKPQRTPTGPEPCHGSDVPRARQDSQELEQRVMRVMSDQMEELRNLRQQVREEPESHGKVEKDSAAVGKAGDSTGACAPKPQERARRAPKSPTNPEERLLPQPKKAAVEDRIPKSPVLSESAPCRSLVSAAEMQLIPCEDCGRRFNPASLEKHRAVCRNVFGKTRSTFESQNQRLRGVKSQEASENSEASRRRHRAVLETKVEVHQPAVAATVTSRAAEAETPAERKAGTSPRRATRESELQPCQHCQRSFRPAALDKHVKVCQSVFPSHDAKRNFQNSRDHRNAKGHTSEVESKVIKATNSTPPRVRPKVAEQAKEKVEREVPESTPMIFGGEQAEPGSPIWSLAFEAPEAAGEPARGLDVWEQEVEEAIQAMSEPIQDVSPTMTPGCPASASSSCLQERATLLERARLGMKMGQRPQQALFGSTSEVVLTADRYRALLPSSTESGATPADRMSQTVQAAPRFFQAGVSTHEVPQYRGVPDYLSRSQPIVPTVAEAPLSSRESRETNRRMEASPIRRLSFQSLGATDAGVSRASGLRLPVQRREPQQAQQGPPVEVRTVPRSQVSAKVKPGVGREDPAPAKISLSQSFTLSASAGSPLQSRSGSMQLPVRSQRTPREQPQAFAVPAAPPPSPSVPAQQRPQISSFETVAPVPSAPSPRGGACVVSPQGLQPSMSWDVSSIGCGYGVASPLGCTTSPLLRVRSVEPPRRQVMVTPQHRTVPRLDLGKVRR